MSREKKISIKEIANISGVSVATVSRVINDNGRFSAETKRKVLKVIEETGYETNYIAKSLRMNKSNTIGILVPDISNTFFSNVVQEIESVLFEDGYATIICNTARSKEKEQAYIKMLKSKMIDGLIVISGFSDFETDDLSESLPVVCIDRKIKLNSHTILIESNHYQGGFDATEELITKGSKNNIILTQHNRLSSTVERLSGFKAAQKKYGLPTTDNSIIAIDMNKNHSRSEAIKSALYPRLATEEGISGIFAINDRLAIEAVRVILNFGLKIPSDVKVVGFDDDPISRYCYPPLTTMQHNVGVIASKACQALVGIIQQSTDPLTSHEVVPVKLIRRETT